MKKFLLILIFFTSFLSLFFSCDNTTEPPPPPPDKDKPTIITSIEDVSCTEVWLKLKITELHDTVKVVISRNDTIIINFKANNDIDTTLYDENLLPNKTYKYKAMISIMEDSVTSNEINAITMDTTSHNFTFETFTFGEHSSSVLYDVVIVNENCIWAVGEIYMNDSLGNPDPNAFNCVYWDGKSWQPRRIYYYGACSAVDYPPLKAIWAFSKNDIVITNGGSIGWFDGNKIKLDCSVNPLLNGAINKIWGTSRNDLYVVGNSGSIAHYQNGVWRKIESGTELNINDIWGDYNEKTNQYEIIAPASNFLESLDRNLLSIKGYTVTKLSTEPLDGTLSSIWFKPNKAYYVGGGGIYKKISIEDSLWQYKHFDISRYYTYRIRGNNHNDIAATGGVGELLHFNGFSWHSYIDQTILPNGNYYGLDIKDNVIVSVGQNNPQAVITIGKRNN